jgi:hypothetical protein
VNFLSSRVEALPEKTRNENCVKKTQAKLQEIQTAVSFPRETPPSQDSIKQLHQLSADLMKDLARKDPK